MPDAAAPTELTGVVSRQRTAAGSKSERTATMLETDQGTFVLRRQGGHPFVDPVLDQLVGKTIRGTGFLTEQTFILTAWDVA